MSAGLKMQRLGMVDVLGRVVAERDDLYVLQPHDMEGFEPPPVVADAHPDDRVERAPDLEALIADLEVALLEMLKRASGRCSECSGRWTL